MNCPMCEGNTMVIDSRPSVDSIKRRRLCEKCGYRFSTVEIDIDMYNSFLAMTSEEEEK